MAATSHDLRQPLHALQVHAAELALLAARRQDATLQRLADAMDRALRRADGLVQSLGDLSRLDAGLLRPSRLPVDLPALLAEVAADHAPAANARGLRLDVAADAGAPRQARTDAILLRRMLDNLVANAVRCTATGSVRLHLVARPDGRPGIAVADTGPGFTPQAETWFRDGGDVPSAGGRHAGGLGLVIVQRLARLLDIGLALDNRPGEGARVEMVLPAGDAPGGG